MNDDTKNNFCPSSTWNSSELTNGVKQIAHDAGFELVGISIASEPSSLGHFAEWFEAGFAGEMHYFGRRLAAYSHPEHVLPSVKSLIVVGINYFTDDAEHTTDSSIGRIAKYTKSGVDYHDVMRLRLQKIATYLHEKRPDCRTRAVVDTAPLLERDFARLSGLGWFGKNTMLINKRRGSYFFLGALLTDLELEPDQEHSTSHCGTCTRCLDACPTDAFVAPYVLDARRCISYLTIELRNEVIPMELRPLMQDWVFGCDVCQDVCPWNRKATATADSEFGRRPSAAQPLLENLLALTSEDFDAQFGDTPLERTRRSGLVRNAAIAAGNSKDLRLKPALQLLLMDADPIVNEAAQWALTQFSEATNERTHEGSRQEVTDT